MDYLELEFELRGKTLPADHGYSLYSALKHKILSDGNIFPSDVLVSSIPGKANRNGMIYLSRSSKFRLRCPKQDLAFWCQTLRDECLAIRSHLVQLTSPRIAPIHPSPTLKSRIVTFKLARWEGDRTLKDTDLFAVACQRSLANLEISAQVSVDTNPDGSPAIRALQVHHRNILGYGVRIEGLSESDSIKLQCHGLGGRKHFGCGWFYPSHPTTAQKAIANPQPITHITPPYQACPQA